MNIHDCEVFAHSRLLKAKLTVKKENQFFFSARVCKNMDLQDFRCLTEFIKTSLQEENKGQKKKNQSNEYVSERVEYLHLALELNNTNTFLLFMNHLVSVDFNVSQCFEKGQEVRKEAAIRAWQELVCKTRPWF
jgi:ubiquitin